MFKLESVSVNEARFTDNYNIPSRSFAVGDLYTVVGLVACCLIFTLLIMCWCCFISSDKTKREPVAVPVLSHYITGVAVTAQPDSRIEQIVTATALNSLELEATSENVAPSQNENVV